MSTAAPAERIVKAPPVLYRQGTSELREDGTIRLSISSDRPYLRYDWWNDEEYYEKLDHSPTGVDLARINGGTALLFNHKRDIHLGIITKPELTEGRCYVAAKISKADDVASYRTRIEEGILKDSSVAYELIDDGEEEGEIDGIPVFRFRWRPFEASLVTIPADPSVGVGRERDLEKPKGEPREIRIREKSSQEREINVDDKPNSSQKREKQQIETTRKKAMTPEEQAAADEKARKQRELDEKREKQERNEEIQDGIKAAREREKEIRAIAKRATVPAEKKGEFERAVDNAIEKAITDPKAVGDFKDLVFEKYWGNKDEASETPGGNGDVKPVNGRALSIGAQFIQANEVKSLNGRLERGKSVGVEMPNISMIGIRGKVAMAQRAGFTSSDLSAVNVTIAPGIIALGVQRLTIMDVIASGSIGTGSYKYARENGFGTIDGVAVSAGAMPRAKAVGERGLKPTWEPDLTTETANVAKVAVTTKVPDEFLADFPSAMAYIDERGPFMVDTETEFQILYGDGLNNNLKGIFSMSGVQTRAVTTTDDSTKVASILQGLTDIQVGAQFEPDFIGFHPYDWETARLLKDSTGRFLAGGPFYIPYTAGVYLEVYTFWGKRVVVSTAITYGRPIAGCGKLGAQALIREGMRIEMTNSNEDDFRRNLVCLRFEHRLALPVYRPVAFLEFTGWPART